MADAESIMSDLEGEVIEEDDDGYQQVNQDNTQDSSRAESTQTQKQVDESLEPLYSFLDKLSVTNDGLEERVERLANIQEILADEIEEYLKLKEAHDQYTQNISQLLEKAGIDPSRLIGEITGEPTQSSQPNKRPGKQPSDKLNVDKLQNEIINFMEQNDLSPQQMVDMFR